jgi:starch synthase
MRVLYAAAEAVPFQKVGGLADVAGALPRALGDAGHDVLLVTPLHTATATDNLRLVGQARLALGGERVGVQYLEAPFAPARAVLVRSAVFDRDSVYGGDDEGWRFAVFSRAALDAAVTLDFAADVLHANDWHTALAVTHLTLARHHHQLRQTRSVITIHNLAFQGIVADELLRRVDAANYPAAGDVHGRPNLLGRALLAADRVTTVSPSYAREIATAGLGMGLEEVLAGIPNGITGILNGIDTRRFDPAGDASLAAAFSAADLAGRGACREALRRSVGLDADPHAPIIGLVARLYEQKGADLVAQAAAALVAHGAQLVVLGAGEQWIERQLRDQATRAAGRMAVRVGFDEVLAQQIYAGADLFLMPSRFEPCGLGQMIAMRYGAVPIVRRTGGLADTVTDTLTGFVFDEPTADALLGAAERAIDAWRDRPRWVEFVRRVMRVDHSWTVPAVAYTSVYQAALDGPVG